MRNVKKLLVALLSVLAIGVGMMGLSACGGSKDSSISTGNSDSLESQSESVAESIVDSESESEDSSDTSVSSDSSQAHKHEWNGLETLAATCEQAGEFLYSCYCGESYTVELRALGHFIKTHEAKAPTCTEFGWEAYELCERDTCNYTTYQEIEATGHSYVKGVCSVCEAKQPAEDHVHEWDEGSVTTSPTCTEKGVYTYNCWCEDKKTEAINELGHSVVKIERQEVSCEAIGWEAYEYCTKCDYTTYEEIPAPGHSLTQVSAKEATCTEIGWGAYEYCSNCDYTTYEEIPAPGHSLTQVSAKAATCTEIGWGAYEYCSNCDYTTYEEIPAPGHSLTQVSAKVATCTEIGWGAYEYCSKCNYTTYEEIPVSHNYVDKKCSICGEMQPSEGLAYNLLDGRYYSVTGIGDCMDTEIIIPSIYEGLPVTSIGNYAFRSCINLTSIVIPEGVEAMGSSVFASCEKLESVVIPSTLYCLMDNSFAYCTSLRNVVIPSGLNSIDREAFIGCTSLINVEIGDSIKYIGEKAFYKCTSLTNIEVSINNKNYKSIDGNLYTKDGETLIQYAIGKTATSFEVPDGVISIGMYAFYYCMNLTSVIVGGSVTDIKDNAFYYCKGLTSIVLGDKVENIGISAFSTCSNVSMIVIGSGVKNIKASAFFNCGNSAGLTNITFKGTVAEWNAITKGGNWDYGVPASKVVCTGGEVAL